MSISSYINDLLYRYDCVIVPNFGGFVANAVSARVHDSSNTFYPPTKQITFNSHLKNNDGLLANYIASSENITFEEASNKIATTVTKWNTQLQKGFIKIDKVGSFSLNKNQQLIFNPDNTTNYLKETFGMSPLSSSEISRVKESLNSTEKRIKKSGYGFLKYAATAAIFLTVGTIGWEVYQRNELKEHYVKQQLEVEKKIQSATFVIDNPLPTIQLTVTKEAAKNFHIMAGSFKFPQNATKKVKQLKSKGFKAKAIGKNKWGLTQVAYASYTSRLEATKNLKKIKKTQHKDAWLLVKKLQ